MKIVVIGPGAMGCLFATLLVEAGHDCRLADKNRERAENLSRYGLSIKGVCGAHKTTVPVFVEPERAWLPDLVIFCVKSFDTASAAAGVAMFAPPDVMALTIQNGLGNIETIGKHLPSARLFAGVTSHGATLLSEGHVFHAGAGDTVVSSLSETDHDMAMKIADILSAAGITTMTTCFLLETLWSKLIINSAIGPVTGLSGLSNGEILKHAVWRDLLRKTALESMETAERAGIKPVYDDPAAATEKVCAGTADNISSMLQDLRAGRRTEVDAINGMIVEHACKNNFDAPVNKYLLEKIHEKEK